MRLSTGKRVSTAFTLIEMMIAIAIFGAVMVSIYSCWNSVVKGTKAGLTAAASAQRGRIALHAVEQALVTAQLFNENNRYYAFVVDSSNEKFSAVQLTSHLPQSFLGSGYFGSETVRRVTFLVERGEGDQNNLVMTQVPLLDASEQKDPYKIVLARDVTRFNLEFWKPGDKDFSPEFNYTNKLPKLVRITLGIGRNGDDSSKPNQLMMRLVNVPSEVVLSRF